MKSFFVTYKNPVTVIIVIILLGGVFAYSENANGIVPGNYFS